MFFHKFLTTDLIDKIVTSDSIIAGQKSQIENLQKTG